MLDRLVWSLVYLGWINYGVVRHNKVVWDVEILSSLSTVVIVELQAWAFVGAIGTASYKISSWAMPSRRERHRMMPPSPIRSTRFGFSPIDSRWQCGIWVFNNAYKNHVAHEIVVSTDITRAEISPRHTARTSQTHGTSCHQQPTHLRTGILRTTAKSRPMGPASPGDGTTPTSTRRSR